MAEKNVKINVKSDSGYDTLYPLSKAENISFNKNNSDLKSTNIKDAIEELDEDFLLTFNLSDTVQPTSEGNALVESIEGDTWQGENPSPENPQHIYGLGDTGYFDGELQKGYYGTINGQFVYSDTTVSNLNKIPCNPGDIVKLSYSTIAELFIVFFKSDDTFLNSSVYEDYVTSVEQTAPNEAGYFRIGVTSRVPDDNINENPKPIIVTINGKYAVKVDCVGKNLIEYPYLYSNKTVYGVTLSAFDDGSYSLNGNSTRNSAIPLKQDYTDENNFKIILRLEAGKKYFAKDVQVFIMNNGISSSIKAMDSQQIYTAKEGDLIAGFRAIIADGETYSPDRIYYPIFCEYEEGMNTDYIPYQHSLSYLPISNPLYKGDQIVKIGSEYKVRRENGYIQSYSSESIPGEYVSSTGELSSGSTVVYKLATPVYEDIDQDQFYSIMAADELTNISLLGENENLVPINVIRFPRNEDGALSTSAFANSNKNKKLINEIEFNIGDLSSLKTDSNETLVEAINEVNSHANSAQSNIGTLTSLTTDSKTNLVGAINEVDSHADTAQSTANANKTNIGTLSSLKTAVKTSIVNAINSLYDNTIGKTLKTLDEIKLATQNGYYADALAIKELYEQSFKCEWYEFNSGEGVWRPSANGATRTIDQPITNFKMIGFLVINTGTDGKSHRIVQWYPIEWLTGIISGTGAATKQFVFNFSRTTDKRVWVRLVQNSYNSFTFVSTSNDTESYHLVIWGLK